VSALIELSWAEVADAYSVGIRRWCVVRVRKLQQRKGPLEASQIRELDNHILGALGELAVARMLGVWWPGTNAEWEGGAPDLCARIEVRTCRKPDGALYVRTDDNPAYLFVLVDGSALPVMRVVGAIEGQAAQRDEWWKPGKGWASDAWEVPQSALTPPPGSERITA